MREDELARMEELPLQIELSRSSVDRVACHRQVDRRQMNTDLMRSSGLEPYIEEGVPRQELFHLEARDGLPRLVRVERVAKRVAAVTPDRRLDPAARRARSADDEGGVVAFQRTPADAVLQARVRLFRARDDHEPRGVAVEPMHDAGTSGISAGDVALEQPLDERAGRMPGGGMHHEARRLVDHDQVLVLVHDAEIHLLRLELSDLLLRRVELELVAAGKAMAL